MKVLITGHLGYIGTVMTPMVLAEGHDVVGLDNDMYRRCTYDGSIPDVPMLAKDVRDVEFEDLTGIDAVCHLAGLSNDPLGDLNPDLTYEINHRASVRLAELAKEAGVERFVFSSSCSNYGAAGEDFLTETSAFNPVTPYGESKVMVEQDVAQMADDRFSPVFLRNATAYGASPRIRFDLVLNNLTAWGFTTGKILMKSDGSPWRPIVHIADIARAFIAVLSAPRDVVHNQAFNVGITDENLRVRDIANTVGEILTECEITFADGASPDKRNYRVNCDKLPRLVPSFQPQWTARKGVSEVFETIQRKGLTLEQFEGPAFQRIAHVRKLIAEGALDNNLRVCG
jgi:nucleoside-diphosphate-sugar epimerase